MRKSEEFQERLLEHIDSIYNYALCLTQNRYNAEDLVQDTALRAYRFFRRFRAGTNFKAWIMTILRNIYINEYRKRIKEPRKVDLGEVEDFIGLPETFNTQEGFISEAVRDLINKLSEELRIALILFYTEGFSYKEIARIMDVPVGTVMSRLYTARQVLKRQLLKRDVKYGL